MSVCLPKWLYTYLVIISFLLSFEISAKTSITWTTEVWSKAAEEGGKGAYFDLLAAVFSAPEFELEHRFLPYRRGIQFVREGRIDIFSLCTEMPEFEQPKHPWAQESLGVIFPKKAKRTWQGPQSLNNTNITMDKDVDILPYINDINAKILKTTDQKRALQLLEKNRVDYYLGIYINLLTAINDNNDVTMDDFNFEPLKVVTCYPGFSPSIRGKRLKKIWDDNIHKLHESGQLKAIYTKWQLEYPNFHFQQTDKNLAITPSKVTLSK